MKRDYTEFDAAILKRLADGPATFNRLHRFPEIDAMSAGFAAEENKNRPTWNKQDPWRIVDRRLQALRKAGKIKPSRACAQAALAAAPPMTREQAAAIAHKHEFKLYQRLLGSAAKPEAVGQAPAWIIDAIMEAAAPHTAAQPVARVDSWANGSYGRNYRLTWLKDVPEGSLLYAAPVVQPAAKPLHEMSAEELAGLARDTLTPQTPVDALRLALDNCGFGPGDTRARLVAEFCAALPPTPAEPIPFTGPGSTLQPQAASTSIPIAACKVGDYVLATKYSDGDPGDRWAVGFYAGMGHDLHMVNDSAGKQIHAGGYRCVIRIPFDVGAWLLKNAHVLESSPPGAVNLLQMVATEFNADRIEEEQE